MLCNGGVIQWRIEGPRLGTDITILASTQTGKQPSPPLPIPPKESGRKARIKSDPFAIRLRLLS